MKALNRIKNKIILTIFITLLYASLTNSICLCESDMNEENVTYIFCVDTSGSMYSYKEDMKNVYETYEYIINCTLNKPQIFLTSFNVKLETYDVTYDNIREKYLEICDSIDRYTRTDIIDPLVQLDEYVEKLSSEHSLGNTTILYISDVEPTNEDRQKINAELVNLKDIDLYLLNLSSQGGNVDVDMKNELTDIFNKVYRDDYNEHLNRFIEYLIKQLGGSVCDGHKLNKKNYVQIYYVTLDNEFNEKDCSEYDNLEDVLNCGDALSSYKVDFYTEKLNYTSVLLCAVKLNNESIAFNYKNSNGKYMFNCYEIPIPSLEVESANSCYRNEEISFVIKNSLLNKYNFNEMFENFEYMICKDGVIIQHTTDTELKDKITFSTDIPGIYELTVNANYLNAFYNDLIPLQLSQDKEVKFEVKNHTPESIDTKVINLYVNEEYKINLDEIFSDADQDNLNYEILESKEGDCNNQFIDKIIEGSELKIMALQEGVYNLKIQASDNYDVKEIIFNINITNSNLTWWQKFLRWIGIGKDKNN